MSWKEKYETSCHTSYWQLWWNRYQVLRKYVNTHVWLILQYSISTMNILFHKEGESLQWVTCQIFSGPKKQPEGPEVYKIYRQYCLIVYTRCTFYLQRRDVMVSIPLSKTENAKNGTRPAGIFDTEGRSTRSTIQYSTGLPHTRLTTIHVSELLLPEQKHSEEQWLAPISEMSSGGRRRMIGGSMNRYIPDTYQYIRS